MLTYVSSSECISTVPRSICEVIAKLKGSPINCRHYVTYSPIIQSLLHKITTMLILMINFYNIISLGIDSGVGDFYIIGGGNKKILFRAGATSFMVVQP